MIKETV